MSRLGIVLLVGFASITVDATLGETLRLKLRDQTASTERKGPFDVRLREVEWNAARTAAIVCDVWDRRHGINAVRRLEQFAPRLNEFVKEARRRGATIIHAPKSASTTPGCGGGILTVRRGPTRRYEQTTNRAGSYSHA